MIRTISLVGMPGSGKSSVGRQLARRLRLPFADSDAVIEQRVGESVRSFFEREGEDRFRELETIVLRELLTHDHGVIATGGGAVLRPENREVLQARSTVVYLRSTPDELFRRLRHDTQRPLLQVDNPREKLRELFTRRDPLYRETAHFIIETTRPTVQSLVGFILMQLELAGLVDPSHAPSPVDPPSHAG